MRALPIPSCRRYSLVHVRIYQGSLQNMNKLCLFTVHIHDNRKFAKRAFYRMLTHKSWQQGFIIDNQLAAYS